MRGLLAELGRIGEKVLHLAAIGLGLPERERIVGPPMLPPNAPRRRA